jgi:hypothetical protein
MVTTTTAIYGIESHLRDRYFPSRFMALRCALLRNGKTSFCAPLHASSLFLKLDLPGRGKFLLIEDPVFSRRGLHLSDGFVDLAGQKTPATSTPVCLARMIATTRADLSRDQRPS